MGWERQMADMGTAAQRRAARIFDLHDHTPSGALFAGADLPSLSTPTCLGYDDGRPTHPSAAPVRPRRRRCPTLGLRVSTLAPLPRQTRHPHAAALAEAEAPHSTRRDTPDGERGDLEHQHRQQHQHRREQELEEHVFATEQQLRAARGRDGPEPQRAWAAVCVEEVCDRGGRHRRARVLLWAQAGGLG